VLPDLAHFHFLRPWWALLLLFALALILVRRRRRISGGKFGGIIAPHLLEHLRLGRFDSRWLNPDNLSRVILLLMILLLMGPSWRQQPSPLSEDEAALVILLDASDSMAQRDVQPSRLQRAKQKITDLLAQRPDRRAALIVYAGSAHTVLTLTADQEILTQYLAAITPRMMPRSGKFPEYALPLVDEVLRDTRAPATVAMFADGLGAQSEAAFGSYFDSRSHQLVVVGVGTERDEKGLAPLERRALERLAARAGGSFIELTVDDSDMRRLDRRIDSHYVVVEDEALPWLDSGYPLVFPTLALFLMWFRRGWTLTWSYLLLPLLLACPPATVLAEGEAGATGAASTGGESAGHRDAGHRSAGHWFADLWLTGDQQGRLLMQRGRYREAASRFEDPMWKAMALYYAEEFMLAAEYFSRSDTDDALFDEANARAHARDYVRAVDRYDRLLARNPDYPGAAQNRQRVQQLIDEINRLSESQQEEAGVSSEEKELGGDDAIPAEGAEELTWEKAELKQFTAEEILQDPATSEMWLRGVQQDPTDFLAAKFAMQLRRESSAEGGR
jgi:Ca-activated chloride channel family protein